MKSLYFTVINDTSFDQRMIRICTSLVRAGYEVTLVGRYHESFPPLPSRPFRQHRISCRATGGKLFYLEYNLKLFLFLLFRSFDLVCAIDLDTIVPCYLVSVLRRKKRVYDAHELFPEQKEVVTRPPIYRAWKSIERLLVPRFPLGYTVCQPIADVFRETYGVRYEVIRNVPVLRTDIPTAKNGQYIIYQGSVNEGRSFETLIPAFRQVPYPLWIFGGGNFLHQCKALVAEYGLEEKVLFKGKVLPEALQQFTAGAVLGLTLFENNGLSNYYSLGNRFFDYIHAGIPQVCVDYPSYREINGEFEVAVLTADLSTENLARTINSLLENKSLRAKLALNCKKAKEALNWQREENKLLGFYHRIFNGKS